MKMSKTGYDRYLEFQFRWTGSFFTTLFNAIALADTKNTERLRQGFPEEVEAYQTWTRIGRDEFLAKCNPEHPLMKKINAGEVML
jgi:hypothetical protein